MTIVVGSGTGANYAVTAGALCRLEETPDFKITGLIATSGSCLPAAFRANGGHMRDFLAVAAENPPLSLIKPHWSWPLVPGLFHLDRVRKIMRKFVPIRFKDCEIPLTTVVFDSDTKEELRFSTDKTPDRDVSLAVQASMSIPWVMRHVDIDGVRCTDGGVVRNFAIDIPDKPAVGIRVLGAETAGKPWSWWGSYSWNHIDGMLRALEREHVEDGLWKKHKIITIESPISGMDFHKVDSQMIDKLFHLGYRAVEEKMA
jgi:hypothetical protein